jgi:hypothetical protein
MEMFVEFQQLVDMHTTHIQEGYHCHQLEEQKSIFE